MRGEIVLSLFVGPGGFPLLFKTPWPLLANTLVADVPTGLLPFPAFIEFDRVCGCSDDENMPLLFTGMTLVVTLS
jgi:hypothetical protein